MASYSLEKGYNLITVPTLAYEPGVYAIVMRDGSGKNHFNTENQYPKVMRKISQFSWEYLSCASLPGSAAGFS